MKAAYVLLLIATTPLVALAVTGSRTLSLLEERDSSIETLCLNRHSNTQADLIRAALKERSEVRKFEPITSMQLKSCTREWLAQYGG